MGNRVLFIEPQPFFTERGSPLRVRATLGALSHYGWQVDLLTYPIGRESEIENVTVIRTPKIPFVDKIPTGPSWSKFIYDVLLFFCAFKLLLSRNYVSIHGVEEGGVVGAFWGSVFRIPYVFDMHSCMSDQLKARESKTFKFLGVAVSCIERWCIARAAAVITVSDDITQKAKVIAPLIPAFTIQDIALDTDQPADSKSVEDLKASLGINGQKVVVYTGNFDPCQGLELLLEGFSHFSSLRDHGPEASSVLLVIVGGAKEEAPRKRKLKALARQLKIDQSVIFTGSRPVTEMPLYMALADVLVSPRISGTNTPLKIYCYMAAEKPLVATRIVSHTQVLDDTCAILAEANPAEMARALSLALNDSPEALMRTRALTVCARQRMEDHYSKKSFYERIKRVYESANANLKDSSVPSLNLDNPNQNVEMRKCV